MNRPAPRRPEQMDYTGKTALITGGASGLGLALAHRLAERGATPLLIDITNRDVPYPLEIADVSDAKAMAQAIGKLEESHSSIDIAIANAAIDITGEAHQFTAEDWQQIINVNLIGASNLISLLYPQMVARKAGQILVISSGAGLIGFPFGVPYTASKSGLIGLGASLRAEARQYGISVCVACPPALETPLLETAEEKPGVDRMAYLNNVQGKVMAADKAAELILGAALQNKSPIIFPAKLTIGHRLATLFPALGERIRAQLVAKFNQFGRR